MLTDSSMFACSACTCLLFSLLGWCHADRVLCACTFAVCMLFEVFLYQVDLMLTEFCVLARSQNVRHCRFPYWVDLMLTEFYVLTYSQIVRAWHFSYWVDSCWLLGTCLRVQFVCVCHFPQSHAGWVLCIGAFRLFPYVFLTELILDVSSLICFPQDGSPQAGSFAGCAWTPINTTDQNGPWNIFAFSQVVRIWYFPCRVSHIYVFACLLFSLL